MRLLIPIFLCLVFATVSDCKSSEHDQLTKVQELIEFGTSKNNYSKICAQKILNWQPKDKRRLLGLFQRVGETCPGLIESAATPGKLSLLLTTDVPKVEIRGIKVDPAATALPKAIQFSNSFLHSNLEDWSIILAVVHELVHEADPGNLISYSQGWCNLALPRIRKVRKDFKYTNKNFFEMWQKEKGKRLLPTFESAANLRECLADCYTYYVCQNFVIDEKAKAIFHRLCNPSQQDCDYNLHYTAGTTMTKLDDNENAVIEFKKASELAPSNPEPLVHLGYCYSAIGEDSKAIACFRKSITLFKILQIPEWDDNLLYASTSLKTLTADSKD